MQPVKASPRSGSPRTASTIRVWDAMHHGVLTCARDTPLSQVADLMARHRVHCVVVADDGPEGSASLWGVVSDLDLVAAASVRELADQTAGATAATSALTISSEETVQRAAQVMTEHATAPLVVVDPAQPRPVGVISTLDVAAALSRAGRPDSSEALR